MRQHALARVAMIAALVIPATAVADDKTTTPDKTAPDKTQPAATDSDLDVMAHYHHLNQMEIDMGKLAGTNALSADVKKYGALMIKDHSKADKDLQAIAKTRKVTIPAAPAPKDDAEAKEMQEQMALMERLKNLKGAEFDREYVNAMVDGHEKELAKVDAKLALAKHAKVKAYVKKAKGSLAKHAAAAKKLQAAPQAKAPTPPTKTP